MQTGTFPIVNYGAKSNTGAKILSYTVRRPTESLAPVDTFKASSSDECHVMDGLPRYASVKLSPQEAATPQGRWLIAGSMAGYLKAYPSVTAVIGMLPPHGDGSTDIVVASRKDAIEGSELGGVYAVMRDLCNSPTLKAQAAHNHVPFEVATRWDTGPEEIESIRLPGPTSEALLVKELGEGSRLNQMDMVKQLVENLPKGRRVALLMAGPSAAGKSTLAEDIKKFAGDRKVSVFPGDMYYRDYDDPTLPKTRIGSVYWDDPQALHFDEMAGAIAQLIHDGRADIPVYDFGAVRPGTEPSTVKSKGMRLDKVTPTRLGDDDILIIDSIHAANPQIIAKLKELDLPHATIYLDAQRAEDRLVRRMVRDYETRGRDPRMTLSDWDLSTFPGEVHFVRPTILQMDPAQDIALINRFPNDLGLTREALDHKVAMLEKHGLAPTYPALKTPDEGLDAFGTSEEKRLRDIAANPQATDADRARAQAAADKIAAARAPLCLAG